MAPINTSTRHRRGRPRIRTSDFGTGYSSLLSLRQISLQAIKIDTAFVANIHTDPEAARFLRAILALGRDLGLSVVAEGIQSPEQVRILQTLGCQLIQGGYPYAHPAPAAAWIDLLAAPPAPKTPPNQTGVGSPGTTRAANRVKDETAAATATP